MRDGVYALAESNQKKFILFNCNLFMPATVNFIAAYLRLVSGNKSAFDSLLLTHNLTVVFDSDLNINLNN